METADRICVDGPLMLNGQPVNWFLSISGDLWIDVAQFAQACDLRDCVKLTHGSRFVRLEAIVGNPDIESHHVAEAEHLRREALRRLAQAIQA